MLDVMDVYKLTVEQARDASDDLIVLLQDAVNDGASIGFIPPLSRDVARDYWQGVFDDVQTGKSILIAAHKGKQIVGCVQLQPAQKLNGRHRAEVAKLIVHTRYRRQGIAVMLLNAIDMEAKKIGLSTLVLDTRQGDPSEQLYLKYGYHHAGVIPEYVINETGELQATVLFYRLLGK